MSEELRDMLIALRTSLDHERVANQQRHDETMSRFNQNDVKVDKAHERVTRVDERVRGMKADVDRSVREMRDLKADVEQIKSDCVVCSPQVTDERLMMDRVRFWIWIAGGSIAGAVALLKLSGRL